jgi:hypothetical protein
MKVDKLISGQIAMYAIGGAVLYFGIVKPLMSKLGVTDSETDKKDEKTGDKAMNPTDQVGRWFNPATYTTWKNAGFKPSAIILGPSINQSVDAMIKALSSGGLIYKFDAAAIIAVINLLPSKYAICQLAMEYQKKTGRDLISDINNRLTANLYGTEGAMARLYDVVNAKSTTGYK